jgi:regulator of protease activity HflC (stomatin/prohibitin superfamily)
MDTGETKMDTNPPVDQRPVMVSEDTNFYGIAWGCGIAIILVLFLFALATRNSTFFSEFGITFNGGPTFLLFAVAYLLFSFKEVKVDEVAATFYYGKALKKLPSGLRFVPFGLMQIIKGPRPVQEFQCPGEPEKVFKGDDKDPLPEGKEMVRPIRVLTGSAKGEKDEILDTRMTITLSFFVQWAITDVLNYASNYGSSAEIEKQARDVGEAILAEKATEHTPATFIRDLLKINQHLATEMGKRFENSGILIVSTRLISPDVSHAVSTALADIPKKRAEAAQVVITATAKQIELTKVGRGTAAAELALLTARADGQKKILDALGTSVDGNAVLASEAVRGILDKTDVLVMGGDGMKDAMGLVKAAQSALNVGTKKGVQS